MCRKLILTLCFVLFSVAIVAAEVNGPGGPSGPSGPGGPGGADGPGESDTKTLRGMSVLGNNEAPMSLFIVPWKSSELGVETNLTRTLDEHDVPVDRDVFMREIAFYQVSVGSKAAAPAAVARTLNSR